MTDRMNQSARGGAFEGHIGRMQQAPLRNASRIGASIYSHSGEFAPVAVDLRLPGRGVDFAFGRSYRSSHTDQIGDFGRGWMSSLAQRLERDGDTLVFHDGAGRALRFASGAPPDGFYGVLAEDDGDGVVLRLRFGTTHRFERPEDGGRLLRVDDRNGNAVDFAYAADQIAIFDTLGRAIVCATEDGLIRSIADHTGRAFTYAYDEDQRLIAVGNPATADFPDGTSIGYAYDEHHRLVALTDAKGQRYLVNSYDPHGRIVRQQHGGGVFQVEYDAAARRTTCVQKNGATRVLDHNELGHVISDVLWIEESSLTVEDRSGDARVPLATTSAYNEQSELIARTFPGGNRTEWTFDDSAQDARDRGNLLRVTTYPRPGAETDHMSLVSVYEYDPEFQLITSFADARGNTTSYERDACGNVVAVHLSPVTVQPVTGNKGRVPPVERSFVRRREYNAGGQLLREVDLGGAITEYAYYPLDDPAGVNGQDTATSDPQARVGYLARIVRDVEGQRVRTEFAYDAWGNLSSVWDGKGNATTVRCNAMGVVEQLTSRAPFHHAVDFRFDANYNEIESAQSFERQVLDDAGGATPVTSVVRELRQYDALDNVISRTLVGDDDRPVSELFVRDAAGRIIRQVQPVGNVTEYSYDERDRVVEAIRGAGMPDEHIERTTYTRNGVVATHTDGDGNTTTHRYDGFDRYRGFTNPLGTSKTQWLDEAGNVTRVAVTAGDRTLMEARRYFDEWDRLWRIDESWVAADGKPLGASGWDEAKGVVSAVVEFGDSGLPASVWGESGNVVSFTYDGAGRVTRISDLAGANWSLAYDENGNVTELRQRTEGVDGERTLKLTYDEMDRLTTAVTNDDPPMRFGHNALGAVTRYMSPSSVAIEHFHDALGRPAGHMYELAGQRIVRGFEFDDNFRLAAYTDASGARTRYRYDALDRQMEVIYPDGATARTTYDARGNVISVIDQAGNETFDEYDAANRLVERRSRIRGSLVVERFEYDAADRLVAAVGPGGVVRRAFDSLSRLTTEEQGDQVLRLQCDAAGNLVTLTYPSGRELHREFDQRRRLVRVRDGDGDVAEVRYRGDGQVAGITHGPLLAAECSYDTDGRLEAIEYRQPSDGSLVEGFRYAYDAVGRVIHEIRMSDGASTGDRFTYDAAGRPVTAEYGVRDVYDPQSGFEQRTSFEYSPEGATLRRVDFDDAGNIVEDSTGTLNSLGRYEKFGDVEFAYDANGNCVRRGTKNPGFCLFTYDDKNRLVKVECFDAQARRTQTIEYFYDAFGRQVRKVVTDAAGVITEYTYVWLGNTLIEEYENGVLLHTYVYALGSRPAQLSVENGVRSDYTYVLTGRGAAGGVVRRDDANAFAEKYRYEVTGAPFVKELGGMSIPFPDRRETVSGLKNSILGGDVFGSVLRDWENGTWGRFGSQLDSITGDLLNSYTGLTGKGQDDARVELGKQFTGLLDMLGIDVAGPAGPPAPAGGSQQGPSLGPTPDWKLYADDEGASAGGVQQGLGRIVDAAKSVKSKADGIGGAQGVDLRPAGGKTSDPGKDQPGSAGSPTPSQKTGDQANPQSNPDPNAKKQDDTPSPEAQKKATEAAQNAGKQADQQTQPQPKPQPDPKPLPADAPTKDKQDGNKNGGSKDGGSKDGGSKDGGNKNVSYFDPDQVAYTQVVVPQPGELEWRFNRLKHPVNPNGDYDQSRVDKTSPPPKTAGVDPTLILYDPETYTGPGLAGGTSEPSTRITTAPIDHVRDWQPNKPEPPPTGDSVHTATSYPPP
jgi:YD repeat-containing protein